MTYLLSIILGLLGLWGIISGWSRQFMWIINGQNSSNTPFVAGLLLCIAIAIFPGNPYPQLCFLAFIIDPDSLLYLIFQLYSIYAMCSPKKKNKLLEKVIQLTDAQSENERLRIHLFTYLWNMCYWRSRSIKKFSDYMQWDEFSKCFFNCETIYVFLYESRIFIVCCRKDLGFEYILECREHVIESKCFASRQELFDNLMIGECQLKDVWDSLR